MQATSVTLEGAIDIDAASVRPTGGLLDSNDALEDFAELTRRYDDQGYLLFRSVLDQGSITKALRRMMAVMARHGIVAADATEPVWTGVPLQGAHEESTEFKGICRDLLEAPENLAVFEKILGEPVCPVPIVQYRSYPPLSPLGVVHQDGFYNQGIHGFRPVWIPLMKIDDEVGGLALAAGRHKQGLVHNLAKPPNFPIAAQSIPEDCWATTTYFPGDVLIVHPHTPHVGLANRSDRVRFSIDTRVQSAANPCVLLGDVVATDAGSMTLRTADGDRRLAVDGGTYIRTGESRGSRVPLEKFVDVTEIGMRVVAAVSGSHATMIRRASEG